MNGKVVAGAILISAALAGAAIYYLQLFGFYEDVSDRAEITLVPISSQEPEVIVADNIRAIDADSSPIRYRACFETSASFGLLTETYVGLDGVTPRNAPGWFDCFDAETIAAELEAGTALAFLGSKNVEFGVDRIVAITDDGRGYVWHELNDCGEKAYDGTIVGEECPRPASATE